MKTVRNFLGWSSPRATPGVDGKHTTQREESKVEINVIGQPSPALKLSMPINQIEEEDFLQPNAPPDEPRRVVPARESKISSLPVPPPDPEPPGPPIRPQTWSAGWSEAWRAALRDIISQGIAGLCATLMRAGLLAVAHKSQAAAVGMTVAGTVVTTCAGLRLFGRGSELLVGAFGRDPEATLADALGYIALATDLTSLVIGWSDDMSSAEAVAAAEIYILQRMFMNLVRECLSQSQLGCWSFCRVVRQDGSDNIPADINQLLGRKRARLVAVIDLLLNVSLMAVVLPYFEKAMRADSNRTYFEDRFRYYLPRHLLSTLVAGLSGMAAALCQTYVSQSSGYALQLIEGGGLQALKVNLRNGADTFARIKEYGSMRALMNTPHDMTNAFMDLYDSPRSAVIARTIGAALTCLAGSGTFFVEQGKAEESRRRQEAEPGALEGRGSPRTYTEDGEQARTALIAKKVAAHVKDLRSRGEEVTARDLAQLQADAAKEIDEDSSRWRMVPARAATARLIPFYGLIEGTMVGVRMTPALESKQLWTAMDILQAMHPGETGRADQGVEPDEERLLTSDDFRRVPPGGRLLANQRPVRYAPRSTDDKKTSDHGEFQVTVHADTPLEGFGRATTVWDTERRRHVYAYLLNPEAVHIEFAPLPDLPPAPPDQ